MAKGTAHRRQGRLPQTRTRTRLHKPKLSDPVQNSADLKRQLRSLGLYAANTLGDGNCLFRALSDQLYGTDSHHLTLRREITDWMAAEKDRYCCFVEDDRSWEDHLGCMREPGTYGGHLELSAFAHLKKRDVKVIQPGLVYVIEWSSGAGEAPPSESGSSGEAAPSPSKSNEDRAARRLRREKQKEEQDALAAQDLGPVYVAYHDWEHFSSVRNLRGPHTGLPCVLEVAPEEVSGPSALPTPPPDNSTKRRGRGRPSTVRDAAPVPAPATATSERSPSPTSLPSFSQASNSSPSTLSSLSPSTPSDSGSLGVSQRSYGGRSPKRSVEETDSPVADVESSLRAAKRRSRLPGAGGTTSEANSEAAWESDADPEPGPSSHPSSQSSRDSSPSPPTPPPVIAVAAPPSQPRLTRRQRKRLGLPKQTKRMVLNASSSGAVVADGGGGGGGDGGAGKSEWIENGTGRLDVRGFRELKI